MPLLSSGIGLGPLRSAAWLKHLPQRCPSPRPTRPSSRRWSGHPRASNGWVTRAHIVLRSAEGAAIEHVARDVGVAIMTVKLWRRRYAEAGLAGLADAPRPGHPPTYGREDRDRVIALTLGPPPEGTTHWSVREHGRSRTGMSPSTVHRRLAGAGPQAPPDRDLQVQHRPGARGQGPRRRRALPRPARAGRSCSRVDEKTQIQALDRTQPLLPLRPGQVERHTHDYTRHGTTCLFAALEVGSGQVTTDHRARHTGADFLAFLRRVARAYPNGELHVVLDNVSHPQDPRRSRPGSRATRASPSTSRRPRPPG